MKKEKRVPKVGDRVAAYMAEERYVGTIRSLTRESAYVLEEWSYIFHRNQIRFIVKNKKPFHEMFLNIYDDGVHCHSSRELALESCRNNFVERGVRFVRAKDQK